MNIQKTDMVSFNAKIRLDIVGNGYKYSNERLAELEKMFEKNTAKQYPKERFSLNSIYDGAYLCGSSKNKNLDSGQYSSLGHFTSKGVEELFNLPDYSIILKIKQLFKILCDKKTEQDSYKKLCRQLEKKGANTSEITNAFEKAVKEATQVTLNKDSILREFKIR